MVKQKLIEMKFKFTNESIFSLSLDSINPNNSVVIRKHLYKRTTAVLNEKNGLIILKFC